MKTDWMTRKQRQLRAEGRSFPWRDALLRMAADVIAVNLSFLGAFVIWYFFYVLVLGIPDPEALAARFRNFVSSYAVFWSLVALLVFLLHGFYTRTRGYGRRYKALVVFRAVTLFVVIFVFTDYFLYRGALMPRGVALIGWLLLLATVGGSRLAKHRFLKAYRVEPMRRPGERPQNVLVVGGAGYLGSTLVPILLERGFRVRVLDSLLFGRESLAAVEHHPRCTVIEGDVRDIQAVVEAMKGCDAVVDLAAIVGDPACEENRALAVEVNRVATRMMIDVARGQGVARFVFASTCSVYGASDFLVDEHTEPQPLSVYAQTKVDSENLLLAARSENFHPVLLRLGTLFGGSPRLRLDLVVNLLTARAARAGKIVIFNRDQWRPFVHVYDAARAFATMLEAPAAAVSGEIFNIGCYDSNHRLAELAEKIARIVPAVEVEHIENEDRRNYRAAFDKVHTRLGFRCHRTLEDGIGEIYEAVRGDAIEDIAAERFHNRARVSVYAKTDHAGHSSIRLLEALARAD
jgi:nucleoside-diphosphate-sugar epimerase